MSSKKLSIGKVFLGAQLKLLRQSRNLTLSGLAELLKVSAGYLSGVESGKKALSQELLILLSEKICVNMNWLLTGEGEMYRDASAKPVDIKDLPKENMVNWLHEFWTTASDDQRTWLKIEFQRIFPEFKEWLQKQQQTKP